MNEIKKPANLEELTALVKSFGPRKEFKPGDVVVCVQQPYGQCAPVPGDRSVIVDKLTNITCTNDGTVIVAGEVADYISARIDEDHPQGYVTGGLHSGFHVLESEYVAPAAETATQSEEN